MILRLPTIKMLELQDLVTSWLGKKSCLKGELQSLAGKLQHACKVVRPGRTFLRRVFELLSVTSRKHHHIRLDIMFRLDLLWWSTFLSTWNGVAIIPERVTVELNYSRMPLVALDVGIGVETNGYSTSDHRQIHLETYLSPKKRSFQWYWHLKCGENSGLVRWCKYTVIMRQPFQS